MSEKVKVQVLAVGTKYREVPFSTMPPVSRKTGMAVTGQEALNQQKLRSEKKKIDPNDIILVSHRRTLNVRKELVDTPYEKRKDKGHETFDEIDYDLFLQIPEIANHGIRVDKKKHLFYMKVEALEAIDTIEKTNLIEEALRTIKENVSKEKMFDLGLFLGVGVRQQSPGIIEARVRDIALRDPQLVLNYFKDESKHRIFAKKLVHHKIVRIEAGQRYFWNQEFLCIGESELTAYVANTRNKTIVDAMGKELYTKENNG